MSIIIRNYETAQVACDECDSQAPQADTNNQAIQAAGIDGFYIISFWTGLEYVSRYACSRECKNIICTKLVTEGKRPIISLLSEL